MIAIVPGTLLATTQVVYLTVTLITYLGMAISSPFVYHWIDGLSSRVRRFLWLDLVKSWILIGMALLWLALVMSQIFTGMALIWLFTVYF